MPNVLVVENNFMIRTMYVTGLSSFDYNVKETQSIGEAKAYLKTGKVPDIVLLDLQLDDDTGLELIRYIRHDLGRKDVRIVVVTGTTIAEEEILSHGADMLLMKPVELVDLLNKIHAYSS